MEWQWVQILADATVATDGVTDLVVKALSGSAAASWGLIALLFIKGWVISKATQDKIDRIREDQLADTRAQRDRAMALAERGTGVAEKAVVTPKEPSP